MILILQGPQVVLAATAMVSGTVFRQGSSLYTCAMWP